MLRQNLNSIIPLFGILFFAGWVTPATASVISAGDIIRIDTDQNASAGLYGGEYALYRKSGPGDEDWEFIAKTFCLERKAPIDTGRDTFGSYFQYVVGSVSDRAIEGTPKNTDFPANDPDFLSDEAKFLYYAHQAGILDTFDLGGGVYYQYNDDAWAQSLQNAIWLLEDEGVYGSGSDNGLVAMANNEAPNYLADYDTTVFALNLFEIDADLSGFDVNDPTTWNSSSGLADAHIQDLLWYSNPVPEPATVLIWSVIGFGGAAMMVRRRRRSLTSG